MSSQHRYLVIEAGFTRNEPVAREALTSTDALLRVSALHALHRMQSLSDADISVALSDVDPRVRRCAVELASEFPNVEIVHLIQDDDVFVAEMTAWSLGERSPISDAQIDALIANTTSHSEPVVREACAAALGSLGDERGLQAILAACSDKPAVRRRAVLALAPFEGEQVDAALQHALQDNDWQVRQNAEVLLHPRD